MTSIADGSVKIQTTSEPNFSTPCWFGEVVVISRYLRTQGVLSKITEQVRFARRRFGRYDVIDFLAVQIALRRQLRTHPGGVLPAAPAIRHPVHGASFSGIGCPLVRHSRAFWQRSAKPPSKLCARCSWRTCSLARSCSTSRREGWWIERETPGWCSTSMGRERLQGLVPYPRLTICPRPFVDWMTCAPPFYRGRKRGEVVRTRTMVSQAHS
jgi:hypothetical protein